MFKKLACSTIVAAGLVLGGCSSSDDDDDGGSNSVTDSDGPNPPLGEIDNTPPATPGVGNSVYDRIVNDSNLSFLRMAIDAAGLADTLDDESSEFTVFAPNNAAFLSVNAASLIPLINSSDLTDTSQLEPVLLLHVVAGTTDGEAAGAAIANGPVELETLSGTAVTLSGSDSSPSGLAFGGADIVAPDSNSVEASVGVVHVIDAVLLP